MDLCTGKHRGGGDAGEWGENSGKGSFYGRGVEKICATMRWRWEKSKLRWMVRKAFASCSIHPVRGNSYSIWSMYWVEALLEDKSGEN